MQLCLKRMSGKAQRSLIPRKALAWRWRMGALSVLCGGGEDTSTRESLFLTRGLQVPNPTAGEAASRQRGPVSLMIRCQQGIALIDEQTPNAKREDLGRA